MHVTHTVRIWRPNVGPDGVWDIIYTGEDENKAYAIMKAETAQGYVIEWTWRPLGE